ncbi:hypothetical protein BDA99DRAFT_534736 [Phascolomyces articulosus]|uniref:Uncharacterized protein n=1 Tax=Phascolomyces articulosus TaxID=60185 RepID=A0AAD5KGV6_9FUNG|nr:hypothetical protein BDA99DRAFT_534736 [Phascolomyces articulosus]
MYYSYFFFLSFFFTSSDIIHNKSTFVIWFKVGKNPLAAKLKLNDGIYLADYVQYEILETLLLEASGHHCTYNLSKYVNGLVKGIFWRNDYAENDIEKHQHTTPSLIGIIYIMLIQIGEKEINIMERYVIRVWKLCLNTGGVGRDYIEFRRPYLTPIVNMISFMWCLKLYMNHDIVKGMLPIMNPSSFLEKLSSTIPDQTQENQLCWDWRTGPGI